MKPLALLLGVLVAARALATQAVPATVEELARASDAVVRGRVAAVTSRWSEDGRRIYSDVEVEPGDVLRGTSPARLTITVLGGVVGGIGQRADGMAAFTRGEEVVVFLRAEPDGRYAVEGHAQGKFSVDGAMARPGFANVSFLPRALRAGERRAEAMPVDELARRVRGAR